jgi:hypothetical protein
MKEPPPVAEREARQFLSDAPREAAAMCQAGAE